MSKNGSICFYAGCPEGAYVSKNGSISFYAGCPEGAYRV